MIKKTLNRMISVMIAFIIFGFIDNFFMIIAGDRFDIIIKESFSVSNTMLAAGLGNTFSDGLGILSGRWVEKIVHTKLPAVEDNSLSKNQIIFSEFLGVIIGCLIGLFPLLFL